MRLAEYCTNPRQPDQKSQGLQPELGQSLLLQLLSAEVLLPPILLLSCLKSACKVVDVGLGEVKASLPGTAK